MKPYPKGMAGANGEDGAKKFYNIAIQTENGPVQKTFSNNEAIAFYKQIYGFPDESLALSDPSEYDRQIKEAAKSAPGFQQWLSRSIVGGLGGQGQEEPVDMEAERRLAEEDVRRDMGIMDYIPFNEPSSGEIDQRLQQRRGMTQQPEKQPGLTVPQGAAPGRTNLKPQYISPKGVTVSAEDIVRTARNRGISEDEVIQRLGLR
jgi:hypothetical protein